MYGVLGRTVLARQDAAIGVRRTQRLGARWRRVDPSTGGDPAPFSFAGYSGELRLMSESGDVWLSKPIEFDSATGVIMGQVDPADTSGAVWSQRHVGTWALVVTAPGGVVTVVVAGVLRITQEGF